MRARVALSSSVIRVAGVLAVLASSTSGCRSGGNDDPADASPPCELPSEPPLSPVQRINPITGLCENLAYGSPICDPITCQCGPPAPPPIPSWAPCTSACTDLDEYRCMATPGCRAGSLDGLFYGCWAVDHIEASPGGCAGLEATECSRRDDCVAEYLGYDDGLIRDPPQPSFRWFSACRDEPTYCLTGAVCPAGQRCNGEELCIPPPSCAGDPSCDDLCGGFCVPDGRGRCFGEVLCDAPEPACAPDSVPGVSNGCYSGACIPLAECPLVPYEECHGVSACDSLPPACAGGQVPQVRDGCWTGACIPPELCEPESLPGACVGAIHCDTQPPACDEGLVPGIANGCFDGTCVPFDGCAVLPPPLSCPNPVWCDRAPPPCPTGYIPQIAGSCWDDTCAPEALCSLPRCTSLTDERACLDAPGCLPVYVGQSCDCVGDDCQCDAWSFGRCE
jgi:hypothetical protein